MRLKNKKGFSLIELAIGVVLLGILVGSIAAGAGMTTKMKVQHESDTVNTLLVAARNYLSASQTTYAGVTIAVLETAGYLSNNFNSTTGNSWGAGYTVAPNAADNTKVDITIAAVPSAAIGTSLTNNFSSQATCVYTAAASTWTGTF